MTILIWDFFTTPRLNSKNKYVKDITIENSNKYVPTVQSTKKTMISRTWSSILEFLQTSECMWADFWISGMDLGEGTSSMCIWKPRKIEKAKFKWIEPHEKSKYVRQVDNVSLFDFYIYYISVIFAVRNHVKLRGFSKDTLLFGGFWLWAWRISWGLQTCIAERSKVPNG